MFFGFQEYVIELMGRRLSLCLFYYGLIMFVAVLLLRFGIEDNSVEFK